MIPPDTEEFKWFMSLDNGLFWKECEENFPITMTVFVQERPENYITDVFSVKIKEMTRLARFE